MITTLGSDLIVVLSFAAAAWIVIDVIRGCPYMTARTIRWWMAFVVLTWLFGAWWRGWDTRSAVIGGLWTAGLFRAYRKALRREARDQHEAIR